MSTPDEFAEADEKLIEWLLVTLQGLIYRTGSRNAALAKIKLILDTPNMRRIEAETMAAIAAQEAGQ